MRLTPVHIKWLKAALHLAAFLPFLWLVLAVDQGWFSADPSKDIQHFTGRMTLKLLLATLMIAPLARYARQPLLIRCRRLVGLWCFARGTLHLISYSTLELGLSNLGLLGSELVNRPYLTLGILTADPAGAGVPQRCGRCANWAPNGKCCTTSSIWRRSSPPSTTCGRSKRFPQPFIYALLAVALLGLRYKKFRARWRWITRRRALLSLKNTRRRRNFSVFQRSYSCHGSPSSSIWG